MKGKFLNTFFCNLKELIDTWISCLKNSYVYYSYYRRPIDKNLAVFISRNGKEVAGNMFYIAKYILEHTDEDLKIVFRVKDHPERARELFEKSYMGRIKIISSAFRTLSIMERAGYVFLDDNASPEYVKREGQIVVNTYHGTPLKKMGKSNDTERGHIGDTQQFFFLADYLVYPNEYTRELLMREYMLEHSYNGKILMTGYPRNDVFFDTVQRVATRKRLEIDNLKVFVYMPTWRGNSGQKIAIADFLQEIDANMTDEQLLFVKFHPLSAEQFDFSAFKHIRLFPDGYQTYDVLNAADVLISDYSSVIFDFVTTGRKIILFCYDEDEYLADRGLYFPLSALPFPIVKTVAELLIEMNAPKNYDDEQVKQKFGDCGGGKATENLFNCVFRGRTDLARENPKRHPKNILVLIGLLKDYGISPECLEFLKGLQPELNAIAAFRRADIANDFSKIEQLPPGMDYWLISDTPSCTLSEYFAWQRAIKSGLTEKLKTLVDRLFAREWRKYFGDTQFWRIVDFGGFTKSVQLYFQHSGCQNVDLGRNDSE